MQCYIKIVVLLHCLRNNDKEMKVSTYSVQISLFQCPFLSFFSLFFPSSTAMQKKGYVCMRQMIYAYNLSKYFWSAVVGSFSSQLWRTESSFVWYIELTFGPYIPCGAIELELQRDLDRC